MRIIRFWLPPFLWGLVIFTFSSFPTGGTSEIHWQDFIIKKFAHIIEYGIFTTLLYRAFKEYKIKIKDAAIYSVLLASFYGFTDEFHQSFTPGRQATLRDVIFDTIGASLAIYLIWKLLPKAPKRLQVWAKNFQII